ncbi:hypothetical protein CPC08DRAFT_248293 [Agrocybe pediades]|nr:hypothetical protein CPC08DRAFT_248293 [Agrocybe pediades]
MQSKLLFTLILAVGLSGFCNADTVVANSGKECDGNEGNTIQCDGSCHSFANRLSLFLSGSNAHCITYFENNDCTQLSGLSRVEANTCSNVNTGTQVNSFQCSPNNNFCS